MLRKYETIFVVRQDATTNQVENLAHKYGEVIRSYEGEVKKTEFCGLLTLAYQIKKNKKGHYILMNLVASPEAIAEMERQMKLNEDVIRYLTVRMEELNNNPSPLMEQRNFKERTFEEEVEEPGSFEAPAVASGAKFQ